MYVQWLFYIPDVSGIVAIVYMPRILSRIQGAMGVNQSRRTRDEVEAEKERYLNMSINSRRDVYRDYTELGTIKTWQQYYEQKISERNVEAREEINDDLNQKISLFRGDITRLEVDAIINSAAKPGKGQVNTTIIRKAGEFYKDECLQNGLPAPGNALVTGGYKLPSKYVINVLAPPKKHYMVLENCYRNCLNAAKQNNLRTIAFPCIATNKRNKFPSHEAANIAARIVRTWMNQHGDSMDRVIFCVYRQEDVRTYQKALQQYFPVNTDTSCPDGDDDVHNVDNGSDGGDTSSTDDSCADLGAAAPKRSTSTILKSLHLWRECTISKGYNHHIQVNRLPKQKLFKQLLEIYRKDVPLTARVDVSYIGEEGIDLGALTREYFAEALETLSSMVFQGCTAFEGPDDHKLPTASKSHVDQGIFEVFGKVVAHAVLNEGIGFAGLSPAVRYLLTHEISRDEVAKNQVPIQVDDVANYELLELLKISNASDLDGDQNDKLLDMMCNANIGYMKVEEDSFEYIKQELMLYEIVDRRWPQVEAIRRGMDAVRSMNGEGLYTFLCRNRTHKNITAVFPSTSDVRLSPAEIMSNVKCNYTYTQTFTFFEQYLRDLDEGKIEDFTMNDLIAFWIGHPVLRRQDVLVVEVENSDGLPTASTCFYQLKLPQRHRTYEDFRNAFTTALKYGAKGFGEE